MKRLFVVLAAVAMTLTAAGPAQAAPAGYPTCRAAVRTTANHTYLSVTGNPQNPNRVYSFEVVHGWPKSTTTRYIPTYRNYTINRKIRAIRLVRAWVNGYKCAYWNGV